LLEISRDCAGGVSCDAIIVQAGIAHGTSGHHPNVPPNILALRQDHILGLFTMPRHVATSRSSVAYDGIVWISCEQTSGQDRKNSRANLLQSYHESGTTL
jgi:hypothetical protein